MLTTAFRFAFLALLLVSLPRFAEAKGPNIVFIMADDLGYGEVGCYGQKQIKTPHIDRLAGEGIRFTDYYAGSTVCAPSRCVLMTGRHTGHARIRGNGGSGNLRPDDMTFAKLLQDGGYSTGMFGKWGLGSEGGTGLPSKQGFDQFVGYLSHGHAHNYYPPFLIKEGERFPLKNVLEGGRSGVGGSGMGVAVVREEYAPDVILKAALEFLDSVKDKPFLLYFPTTLPHANGEARKAGKNPNEIPSLGEYANRDWPESQKGVAAMISRVDQDVGTLLAKLKEHKLDENTIVFFTSDNGPHKEGDNDPTFFASSGALRGIKRSLNDGGIRVPMIVRWPGHIQPATATNHVSYHGDVMATLCDLANLEVPPRLDSISFAPTLLGKKDQQQEHEYLYWEFYEQGYKQAVRAGDWKLVIVNGKTELHNLTTDVGEKSNVASEHPEIFAKLKKYIDEAHVPDPNWVPRPT
jgi:arylsulfatase A-like enzyme